jgi:hypothetical protein
MRAKTWASVSIHTNAAVLIALSAYLLLAPAATVLHDVTDPSIRGPGVPRAAVRLFKALTPRYARWAEGRLRSDRPAVVSRHDVSGTEWPLFGSVLYLWSVESLQRAWEQDESLMATAPSEYAAEAVDASVRLVADPAHAWWVRQHWGDGYLHRENVFYRMLLIAALTAHARLSHSEEHLGRLRDQVEELSAELDASPHGLLEDYPGECYPGDVLTAVACIQRADAVLGTDHSGFVRRSLRGFQGVSLDRRGLVPYAADADSGESLGPSRGCGNSYVCLSAPEVWPEQAGEWYRLYEKHFWQTRWGAVGFREFPRDMDGYDWYMDVDAGPVLAGFGFAACAFGVGAARANGRFDHAYPLAAEMLAASWPLPNGTLLVPRVLSDPADAPYLGEAAILDDLTRMPVASAKVVEGGGIPLASCALLLLVSAAGLLLVVLALRRVRRWRRRQRELHTTRPRLQAAVWGALLAGAVACLLVSCVVPSVLLLLVMHALPRLRAAGDVTET